MLWTPTDDPPARTRPTPAYRNASQPVVFRTKAEVSAFFGDFDLVAPGVVWVSQGHPGYRGSDNESDANPARSKMLAGVARKPAR
ncbi:SAM-dependent methyltransferase [Amycolatopsis taiwanensis]